MHVMLRTPVAIAAAAVAPLLIAHEASALQWGTVTTYGPGTRTSGQPRIWVDGDRTSFAPGDRMGVRFSVPHDSYVAVLHIDPDGYLEFLYPSSPRENEFVRGGVVRSVRVGADGFHRVRNAEGIGYLYLLASPYPLDFGFFTGSGGSGWYWGSMGRVVRGDPFLAFEQVTRLLVPRWPNASYVYDHYGYHVGGVHAYPTYACSGSHGSYGGGWGWYPAYGPCSALAYVLRDYPDYYDTRRFRGDRRAYLRQLERTSGAHRFKEDPRSTPGGFQTRVIPADQGRSGAVAVPTVIRGTTAVGARPGVDAGDQPPVRAGGAGPAERRPSADRAGSNPARGSASPAIGRTTAPTARPSTNRAVGAGAGAPSVSAGSRGRR